MKSPESEIFNINSEAQFTELALRIFHFQYNNNLVYKSWVDCLKINPLQILKLEQIPFLPIEFFKNAQVVSTPLNSSTVVFKSSATTSQTPSLHYVNDIGLYEKSFLSGFNYFYGNPADYCIIALLPNYLERKDSSLVYMFHKLIKDSKHIDSGFFKDDILLLINTINKLKSAKQKTILIGVSYALLDLCEQVELDSNFIVMETGGMKGTRKEMLKEELHEVLKNGFKLENIHSEYGMTELLSQAYSSGNGIFNSAPWLKFLIREISDPLKICREGKTGGINVIDLANINSCSFIATKDLGRINGNTLEIMGRFDESDVRGCNLMINT